MAWVSTESLGYLGFSSETHDFHGWNLILFLHLLRHLLSERGYKSGRLPSERVKTLSD